MKPTNDGHVQTLMCPVDQTLGEDISVNKKMKNKSYTMHYTSRVDKFEIILLDERFVFMWCIQCIMCLYIQVGFMTAATEYFSF